MSDHLFKIARENSFHNFYNIHVNEFQLSALNFPYCKNNAEMFHCQEDRLKQNLPRRITKCNTEFYTFFKNTNQKFDSL